MSAVVLYLLGAALMVVAAGWYDEIENARLPSSLRAILMILWPAFVVIVIVAVAIDRFRKAPPDGARGSGK